jgi:hypothetical protein
MKFIATQVYEIDRKLEIEYGGLKHKEITLSINLTSSGDTREFTSNEIASIILEKLREITKP